MKKLLKVIVITAALGAFTGTAIAADEKSKFYDFSDQLIDGEIKKPTALYTDSRQQVRFERLISLKKSFMNALLQSSKERVFK